MEKNLHYWINRLKQLQGSSQKLGYDKSVKESIRAMHLYGCTMPDSNVPLSSFSDIMLIFSDKTWYNDNAIKKQSIIHMICCEIIKKEGTSG